MLSESLKWISADPLAANIEQTIDGGNIGDVPRALNTAVTNGASAHANYRSYAAATAKPNARQGFKQLNGGIHGNITWASKLMEGRQLDRGLALKKVDVDKSTGVILTEEDVVPMDVWGYSLVGRFAGRFPGTKAISTLCDS
jgi:hypothetical protein